jgi:uncharacterized protein (DUF2132 family)
MSLQNTPQNTKPASLDGITLATIVTDLSQTIGWEAMAHAVPIRCFTHDPSIASSLKFLRRTPWARVRVEQLYLSTKLATPSRIESINQSQEV